MNNIRITLALIITMIIASAGIVAINVNDNLITGHATSSQGVTQLYIQEIASIQFNTNVVGFGTGTVSLAGGNSQCILTTNEDNTITKQGCTGFEDTITDGFVIENDGNVNLSVTIRTQLDPLTQIGGTSALAGFEILPSEDETGSCPSMVSSWETMSTTPVEICPVLGFLNNADTIRLDVRLSIPYNAPGGTRSITIIAEGTS